MGGAPDQPAENQNHGDDAEGFVPLYQGKSRGVIISQADHVLAQGEHSQDQGRNDPVKTDRNAVVT